MKLGHVFAPQEILHLVPFSAHFPYFEKIKIGLRIHFAVSPPEPIFPKFGMYIMTLEPISTAYFINPPIVARQRLGKHVPAATNTQNNRRTVGCVVFYKVRVISKESR
jgi:hypothetical protein